MTKTIIKTIIFLILTEIINIIVIKPHIMSYIRIIIHELNLAEIIFLLYFIFLLTKFLPILISLISEEKKVK